MRLPLRSGAHTTTCPWFPRPRTMADGLTAVEQTDFDGVIRVASRIVDYLSSGLYHSPAACLKELVNNAYDADATTVHVLVKPDADRIIIDDDGVGMTKDEFVAHFDRVSESHKRDDDDYTERHRPKIGKIGIGFIAANEICEKMQILSTKEGSTDLLDVTIDFAEMRKDIRERRQGTTDFAKGDYHGVVRTCPRDDHYTKVFLRDVRGPARDILASVRRAHSESEARTLYGLGLESIEKKLTDADLQNWSQFDAYSETMLRVGLNVPVRYLPHWLPHDDDVKKVQNMVDAVEALGFAVSFDGVDLRKPTIFPPSERHLLRQFAYQGNVVSATGYLYAQRYVLRPQNLNGLLVRIRNAAVGEYDSSFWDFPNDEATLFQRWTSVEVWADDRLEDALNIDRRTLRVMHPAYVELQKAIHAELSTFWRDVRKELYAEPTMGRRREQAKREAASIERVVQSPRSPLSPQSRVETSRTWTTPAADDRRRERNLLRKYTVAQLYEMVIDVANEVLDKETAAKFVQALTRRLNR